MSKLKSLFKNKRVKNVLFLCLLNLFSTIVLLFLCHNSKSMALTAFTYLTIFDLFSLLTIILNLWIQTQGPSVKYPYGYKRAEVLAIFSCTILSILGALFITKECVEAYFEPRDIHTSRYIPATIFAFLIHMIIVKGVKNDLFDNVIQACSSSWLQEHVTDLSETFCRYIPVLSKLLLPRVNPFSLLGFACLATLFTSYSFLQIGSSYIVDINAAILIAIMTVGTMFPMSIYTAKILLQTTPTNLIGQLDKCLREASTLDGVLEFRNEHFWTVSFGTVVGSLHVRVRRDADEQLVLAHVWNKLAGLVQILTIHIFKDDWIRRTTHQLVYNSTNTTSNNYSTFITQPPLAPIPSTFTQQQSPYLQNPLLVNSRKNQLNTTIVENEYIIVNQ